MNRVIAGLNELSAFDIRNGIAEGRLRATDVAEAVVSRTAARDGDLQAFAFFDADMVRRQGEDAQRRRETGRPQGALAGVPVGVKDVIDTKDMPTERGTPIDAGRRPRKDAAVVSRLREAGAVIAGKTETSELAFRHPGRTRNPLDPARTPGGSSSGSAAAVAAGLVPLAIGTQTNGSVIRPASYCGVVGFKPTHGLISRAGILPVSPTLDVVGMFGRKVEDVAMLADVLAGYDANDLDTVAVAAPRFLDTALAKPPVRPAFAFVETFAWPQATPETKAGFHELAAALGPACVPVPIAEIFADAPAHLARIMFAEMAVSLAPYYEKGAERLSPEMRAALEEGGRVTAKDYLSALDWRRMLAGSLDSIFDRYDAILTPAAAGEAPMGLESTGDPIFCTLWQLCGFPAVTLPLLEGPNGLPVGVQLVGRANNDARLLRTARWLMEAVQGTA